MTNAELYDIYIEGHKELADAIDMFEPISEYASIFEADDPAVQQKVRTNEEANNKAQSGISKILNAIKRIIKNVITSIRNFFDRARLSAEEKKAYDAFKAACAKDPSLANKKITVRAWEEIEKRGAELRKQGEALLREENANPTACEQFVKSVESYVSSTVGGVGATVTVDILKKSMVKCPALADMVLKQMQSDNEWCERLEKSMGEKSYNKFKNYTTSMQTRSRVMMALVRVGKKRYENLHDTIESSIKGVTDLAQGKITMDAVRTAKGALENESLKNNVIKPATYVGKAAAGAGIKQKLHDINNVTTTSSRYARNAKKLDQLRSDGRQAGETQEQFDKKVSKYVKKGESLKKTRMKELEREHKKAQGKFSNLTQFVIGK